ncbi:MAG TPA: vanadium-dependent haloperoxidase [Candidatus Dormibacteraeota bacterium]|nr:vanadium-dependent haloperoxidase [Candidatus Dormibacteraeota bacterium]
MKKSPLALVAVLGVVLGIVTSTAITALATNNAPRSTPRADGRSGAIVVAWNRELLHIVQTPGDQPATVHPTRSFAIVHAAIYDAVVSITKQDPPYLVSVAAPRDARIDAAAAQAAHDALVALYPKLQPELDALLASQLATIPDGKQRAEGVQVGSDVAARLIADRANDGSSAVPSPFVAGTQPGDYRPTPPKFPAPVFTGWSRVAPLVLDSASEFRSAPPPAVTSAAYADALNQVKSLGRDTSTTRTADQTVAAKFWAPPIWNTWNEIADRAVTVHNTNLETTARLFAVLNLSFADSVIAFYDAKYHFAVWRPVTAIRLGDTIGNPAIQGDPNWTPLAVTAADPSFPGAHSTVSAAGAAILSSFFGDDRVIGVTSDAMPGIVRTFVGYAAIENEAGLSRIYAGQHTPLDDAAGRLLGSQVAQLVLRSSRSADFGSPAAAGSTAYGY